MYDIISRERAGLLEPRRTIFIDESYTKGLTVHNTGAAVIPSIKNIDDVFTYLINLQRQDMNIFGYDDIRYSFAISNVTNEIVTLRGFGVYSEHTSKPQINRTFLSVLWLGGINDNPNENALEALDNLVEIISTKYKKNIMVDTENSGDILYEWITSDSPRWKKPKRKASKWSMKKLFKKALTSLYKTNKKM
tara:strand:+ start:316 stop:891 length:576 start_codon:yes stop_codon:yes gene_type:complete